METLIVLLVVAVVGWVFWKLVFKPDHNEDGKVDLGDVKSSATEVVNTVKSSLDVNKDGKVNLADVKAAGEKTVKKVAARKPRTKKAK
jgi:hypothetical protein